MNAEQLKSALLGFTRPAYPDIKIQVQPWPDDLGRLAIYFTEPKFSLLYPAQRHHYLAHLIPRDFFQEHLADTVWFELAPYEKPEDLQYPDEELVRAITPDVMRAVERSGVLGELDDLFSPSSPETARVNCLGDFRHSRQLFLTRGFKEDELFDLFHVLMAQGGFCDCEILYNAADSSRLKAEYWRARAENREPYDPHQHEV
ncbi:MAG TPA: DUF2695 domain-containing protein [Pyrinomonadaceae bacterium]|nr:DUF2695 domain-containing protein [Pyrinomonadaceae bacterium]